VNAPDPRLMRAAVDEALAGLAGGDGGPFGAVVVRDGVVIARGHNQVVGNADPTAHAEVQAIRAACASLGTWNLAGCDIYCSCEPCPMCAGAALMARIRRLVYGAPSKKAGAVETHCRMLQIDTFNHRIEVTGGVRAGEAAALLSAFFRQLRGEREMPQE